MNKLMTTTEVAELLGVSIRTVTRLARIGRLPGHKLPGQTGSWVFDRVDVEAFVVTERRRSERQAS